jgi:hypothetical protein
MTLSKAGLTTGSARLLHAYLVRLPIRVWFRTAKTIKNVTTTNIPMVQRNSITRSWPRDGRRRAGQPGDALEIGSIAGCTAEAPRRLPLLLSGIADCLAQQQYSRMIVDIMVNRYGQLRRFTVCVDGAGTHSIRQRNVLIGLI